MQDDLNGEAGVIYLGSKYYESKYGALSLSHIILVRMASTLPVGKYLLFTEIARGCLNNF
jgi:hypothetical protein